MIIVENKQNLLKFCDQAPLNFLVDPGILACFSHYGSVNSKPAYLSSRPFLRDFSFLSFCDTYKFQLKCADAQNYPQNKIKNVF